MISITLQAKYYFSDLLIFSVLLRFCQLQFILIGAITNITKIILDLININLWLFLGRINASTKPQQRR